MQSAGLTLVKGDLNGIAVKIVSNDPPSYIFGVRLDMRSLRLTSLRKETWYRGLAVFMALTLIAGLVFNCCRINESIAASITKHLITPSLPEGSGVDRQAKKSHPGCHGHGAVPESAAQAVPLDDSGSRLISDEACLSEVAATPKALKSSSLEISGLFQASSLLTLAADPIHRPHFTRPKPQNKSSPPLYLLTLRIIV